MTVVAGDHLVDEATGEVIDELHPDEAAALDAAPDETSDDTDADVARCGAVTEAGGNEYRCALQERHDGDHEFQPVDDTDTAAEPEPEPGAAGQSEAEMLKANRAVAKSAQTYWAAVQRNYGDDLGGFHECPLCVGYPPGLYFPAELPQEKRAALNALLGYPSLDNYRRDNAYLTCATCDGLGTILTGSKVPKNMTAQCADCGGKGWITESPRRQVPERAPILDGAAPAPGEVDGEPPPFDPWGRPHGDPDYYRMPIVGVTT